MRLLSLLACAVVLGAHDGRAQATPERTIDSLFAPHNEGVRPGLAVAVVREGRLVFSRGYGMANLEHRVRIAPTTVFDIASISKQFAGLAIAMLVDQGRVRLTDDVRRYIPELGDVGHVITIDHLVHHTSGLRDWPGSLALAGWRMDDVISFDQILRFAFHQRSLNFAPGAEYTYSNTGYNLLAEVVARVSGRPFAQFTAEQIFRPLGMTRSRFHDDVTEFIPDRALGYARADTGWRSITDNLTALGSSSLFTTVEDLARWIANFEDPRVGGAAAMTMTRARGRLNDGSTIPYAFGISHGEYRGQPTVAHSGSWAQFATYLVHFPQQRLGVVVLANSSTIDPGRAALAVVDAYLGSTLAAPVTNAPPLAMAPVTAPSSATLDRYVGLYRLGPGWYVRIRRDGNALTTHASREQPAAMSARSDTSFWVEQYRQPMAFTNVARGPVTLVYRGRQHPRLDESRASSTDLAALTGEYESAELGTRYRVELTRGALVLQHYRHGTIPLTRLHGDDFGTTAWFMRSVEFRRDAAGKVTGFSVFIDERSRDVRFARVR